MAIKLVRAMHAKAFLHLLLVVLAAIGVLTLAVLGLFPKLITGNYCKVTVVSIKVDKRGQTELVWKGIHSSGTSNSGWTSVNGVRTRSGGGSGGGFPAWPVTCGATTCFSLNFGHEDLDRATLLSRLKVIDGETYTIRPGQPLILYQYTDANGTSYEGGIEVPA